MSNDNWKCPGCGESNEPDADLCHQCGLAINVNFPQGGPEGALRFRWDIPDAMVGSALRSGFKALFILPLVFFALLLFLTSAAFGREFAIPAIICIILALGIGVVRGKILLPLLCLIGGFAILGAWFMLDIANSMRFFK